MANGTATAPSGVLFDEIARREGISARTVRRLLNGPLRDTRPSIMRRAAAVRAHAETMGYRPNAAARAVATGRFRAATLLMTTAQGRSHSSFELLRGLHTALAARDMHLNVAWLPDEQLVKDGELPKVLREWMCDGLIINYTHRIPARMAAIIAGHQLPCVWLNCVRRHDGVRPDDALAGRLATEPLLARGCHRIVFLELGVNYHDSASMRCAGYRKAMRAAGREPEVVALPLPGNATAGSEGAPRAAVLREWLASAPPPDGVVTYSAWTAEPLLYAAATLGLRIPDDLAVTTIEDAQAWHLGRPVTTVVLDLDALARESVDMLARKIADPAGICEQRKIPPLLVRGDTA